MNSYIQVIRKYADFSGRSRRTEYWVFTLINLAFAFGLGFVDGLAGLAGEGGYGPLGGLYALAVLIPSFAVGVRRLHDINRSGWWLLIMIVPLIGAIVLIVFLASDSQPGSNQYGPNPKEVSA